MALPFEYPDPRGFIRFPRSDGNPDVWPGGRLNVIPADSQPYIELPLTHKTNREWRLKIGGKVAEELMHLTETTHAFCLAEFPANYKLYKHPRKDNKGRSDIYLYGSEKPPSFRFRSPAEFVPHAIWLLTNPEMDTSKCKCTHCDGTPQMIISVQLGMRNPPAESTNTSPVLPSVGSSTYRALPPPADANLPPAPAVTETEDAPRYRLRTRAPREGELIWISLPTPLPSESSSDGPGQAVPPIAFWPAVVLNHTFKPYIAITSPPKIPQDTKVWEAAERSRQRFSESFDVRVLGTQQVAVVRLDETLPFLAYTPPQTLVAHLAGLRPNPYLTFDTITRATPFRRKDPGLSSLAPTFEDSWPAYALALEVSLRLKGYWTATDPYPSSGLLQTEHTRYEGVYWGPERIWEKELVRLYIPPFQNLSALPPDDYRWHVLRNVTSGAEKRGLFVRVLGIHLVDRTGRLVNDGTDGLPRTSWVEGTVYETVPLPVPSLASAAHEDGDDSGSSDGDAGSGRLSISLQRLNMNRQSPRLKKQNLPLDPGALQDSILARHPILPGPPPGVPLPQEHVPFGVTGLPPPPKGYTFRPLLASDERVYIAMHLLAGRYYPYIGASPPLRRPDVGDVDLSDRDPLWVLAGLREAGDWERVLVRKLMRERGSGEGGAMERAERAGRLVVGDKWGMNNGNEGRAVDMD